MRKNFLVLFSMIALAWSFNIIADVLMSDDFEREYNDSNEVLENYGNLGTTKEGYKWVRRDLDKNGVDLHCPGILEYKGGNKGLIWKCPTGKADIVSINKKLKNFKLEFDYYRTGEPSFHGITLNFRMSALGGAVSDGGKSGGYALLIMPLIQDGVKLRLLSDYGLTKESTEISTGKLGGHISIVAKANNIKVYVGETLALDITDTTENPSKDKEGFFTIQGNRNIKGTHCIDNWCVNSIE